MDKWALYRNYNRSSFRLSIDIILIQCKFLFTVDLCGMYVSTPQYPADILTTPCSDAFWYDIRNMEILVANLLESWSLLGFNGRHAVRGERGVVGSRGCMKVFNSDRVACISCTINASNILPYLPQPTPKPWDIHPGAGSSRSTVYAGHLFITYFLTLLCSAGYGSP